MPRILPSGHYVYLHKKASNGVVFYVGKGHGRRAYRYDGRNLHWKNTKKKHGLIVEIFKENMNELCAFTLEKILIAKYGVNNLCNQSSGGEGPLGIPKSQSTKDKISIKLGKPVWNCSGELFTSTKHAARVMKLRGYPKASHSGIYSVISGKCTSCYGHSWSYFSIPEKPENTGNDAMVVSQGKRLVCIDNGMIFRSCREAGRWIKKETGIDSDGSTISACCRGVRKKAFDLSWKYLN